jgi:hypothetical protein
VLIRRLQEFNNIRGEAAVRWLITLLKTIIISQQVINFKVSSKNFKKSEIMLTYSGVSGACPDHRPDFERASKRKNPLY